ncbi:hypothetical protein ACJJTC_000881 [Scirpophaga incertulas]
MSIIRWCLLTLIMVVLNVWCGVPRPPKVLTSVQNITHITLKSTTEKMLVKNEVQRRKHVPFPLVNQYSATTSKNEPTTDPPVRVFRAVRNFKAYLPCAPGKIFLDGPEAYVVWLKDDAEVIHRFPNENSLQTYLDPNNLLGNSCPEKKCHDGTSLFLPEVAEKDAGQYRCRVHYQNLSSVDYVIDLRVVEASDLPKIYTANHTLITSYIGPLDLGSNVTLLCEVVVIEPPTTLIWLRDNTIIARVSTTKPGILQERIHLIDIKRDEYKRRYQCTSSNSDVTEPFVASVVIEMHLPPLSVEIRLNNKYEFEVDQPRVVDCVVTGCVPMPTVDWYLDNTLLKPTLHKEIHDGNYTVSSLTLTAAPSYINKHKLTCQVHNDNTSTYTDNVPIYIGFRPRCVRNTKKVLNVVEGEAETVTCMYKAAPGPIHFSWVFPDSRIINTYGEKVLHQRNIFSTTLTWKPREGDIGILYCRAVNSFGVETEPCSYELSQSSKPESPNCVVNEFTNSSDFCGKGDDLKKPAEDKSHIYAFVGFIICIVTFCTALCLIKIFMSNRRSGPSAPGNYYREGDVAPEIRTLAGTSCPVHHIENSCSSKTFHLLPLSPLAARTEYAVDTYYV